VILGFVARLSVTFCEILHSKPNKPPVGLFRLQSTWTFLPVDFKTRRLDEYSTTYSNRCSAILSFAAPLLPELIEFLKRSSKIEKVTLWRPLWRRQEVDNYGVLRSPTLIRYQIYIDWGGRWFVASQRTCRRGMVRFWATCTKIAAFSLQVVSARKSATKPFQDQPFWWQPHQIHIKV